MLSKIKVYAGIVFVLALLALSSAVIAQEEETGPAYDNMRWDAPTYAQHGPYWIGTREIEVENGERLLRGNIWYPALNPDGVAYEDYGYSSYTEAIWEGWGMGAEWASLYGTALGDAPVDASGAPYPFIILTHGYSVSRTLYTYLAEHLASHGFVVVAVEHPGGGFSDQLMYGMGSPELLAFLDDSFTYWVLDELRMIEYAGELTRGNGDFAGMIDITRIGATGNSTGGYVALLLAGAQFDFGTLPDVYAERCTNNPNAEEVVACDFPQIEAELAEMAGVDFVAGEPWGIVETSAVQAVFTTAPGTVIPFGMRGTEAVSVPVVIMAGTIDSAVHPATMQYAHDTLGSEMKSMVWMENAGHFPFIDCGWQTPFFGGFCADGVWDMQRAHDLTNHFATALFLGVLYDDAEAMNALYSDAVDFAGITYETTLGD
jgi:predicted dienelactone hydrolase